MTHAAFYYLVGQGTTYLVAKSWLSFMILLVVFFIDLIAKNFHTNSTLFEIGSLGLFWGWLSVAYITEHALKAPSLDFVKAVRQIPSLYIVFEIILYCFVISGPILLYEYSLYLWLIQIFIHVAGIFALSTLSLFCPRYKTLYANQFYYTIWIVINIVNDVMFLATGDNQHTVFWTSLGLSLATWVLVMSFLKNKHFE